MKVKGAIFDLDGTLLDSMPIWDDLGARYLRKNAILPPADLWEIVKTLSLKQVAEYFREEFELPKEEEEIMAELNAMIEEEYRNKVPVKEHVLEFLKDLQQQGVKMCVATATDKYLVEAALERLALREYFEFIITCSEVKSGKDQPEIFIQALNRLGTKLEETVVFEDALHAIRTAKSAGFPVIALYDLSFDLEWEEITGVADLYLKSFAEYVEEE